MLANFLEFNSKGLYQSSGKEKEICCLVFRPSSSKREFRHFHVVVVQRWQRNVQKSVITCKVVVLLVSTCYSFAVVIAVAVVDA